MIPRPAQYLLRLDDLCPTFDRKAWPRFRELVEEFGIRPILAVVPDNQDAELESSRYDAGFWAEMREMEAVGATIAIHGYRHLCAGRGKSLLGLHYKSEFAGVNLETQRRWIRAGRDILRGWGLNPRLWAAPRHGFDWNTLCALRDEGVGYISDGFARVPFVRGGITWIPQQLWAPVHKTKGLWTICIHPGTARTADVDQLRAFLMEHSTQFTSFDRVAAEFAVRALGMGERIYQRLASGRVQMRNQRARRKRGNAEKN
jgi:predicted deacetylase